MREARISFFDKLCSTGGCAWLNYTFLTLKERDIETGLDYFGARYYSSTQGRFTSADDFLNDTHPTDPAGWNLYAYVRNNPQRSVDPTGERIYVGDINNAADRDELLRRANYTYGCKDCVTVDKDGFLSVNTAGLSQDVLRPLRT
jgi:RHS repeat-associated protein